MLPSVSRENRIKGVATVDRNTVFVRFPTGSLGRRLHNPIIRYLFPVIQDGLTPHLDFGRNEGERRREYGIKCGIIRECIEIME